MSIDLALKLNRIKNPRLFVLGDRIGDVDIHGHFRGFAQENGACPVFVEDSSEGRPGGEGAVAAMAQALGCSTLQMYGNLSVKRRFFVEGRQVFRYDCDARQEGELRADDIPGAVEHSDCVLIADYGKGACTEAILRRVIDEAKRRGKPVIVDPHGNDWSKYRGCTALKCNVHESPSKWWEADHGFVLIVTQGEAGMCICTAPDVTVPVPARSRKAVDVTGAGDMVLAALGLCTASGLDWLDACQIANAAAGRKCEKHGAVPVSRAEVIVDLCFGQKVIPTELLGAVATARRSEKIVLTNGCWDVAPHQGHLHLLREAKALGALIVAVNDDESVRALKGPNRPIVPLEQRMEALAALECVDYVVPFGSEAELEQICKDVRPDVLCKGGSYAGRHLTGEQYAKEVKLVPLVEGISTTTLIQRLQSQAG